MGNTTQSKLIQKAAECEKLKAINKSYVYLMDEYRTENEELKSDIRILVQALSVLRKANRVIRVTLKNQLQKA
jgi:hypothetical protein